MHRPLCTGDKVALSPLCTLALYSSYHLNIFPSLTPAVRAHSPRDVLGLLSQPPLKVFPRHGRVSPGGRLHHVLSVAALEAADELLQGHGSVLVHVQSVEDLVRVRCRHLQLRADRVELAPLHAPGAISVVRAEERAQPVPLLRAHAPDGWRLAGEMEGATSKI